MIKEFEVRTFKKFPSLKLDDLSEINIILGRNNVGKTSILESLFAHACGENLHTLIASILRPKEVTGAYDFAEKVLNAFYNKNVTPFTFCTSAVDEKGVRHLFEHTLTPASVYSSLKPNLMGNVIENKINRSTTHQININNGGYITQSIQQTLIGNWKTHYNGKKKKEINISYPEYFEQAQNDPIRPHLNGRFVDILTHRDESENRRIYALLKRETKMKNFVSEISKTFEDINGIDMLPYPDGTNGPVSIETDRGYIPLQSFGDGLQRYFNIIGGLFLYQNGIHCIEEVDATFHPEAQESFSKSLLIYSSLTNNQVFMTSHSAEFVDNFLRSVANAVGESGLEKIRVITLKNIKENVVRIRTLTGGDALMRRNDYEMALR